MRVSFIVATIGRPTLERALTSIRQQSLAGDEVLVVGATLAIRDRAVAMGCRFLYSAPGGDWGGTERNIGMRHATGEYLAFLDDDDMYVPDARWTMETAAAIANGRPMIFQMAYPETGDVLWHEPVLEQGNVGCPMFVVPNDPQRLGTWGHRYECDFDFLSSMRWAADEILWVPTVVAHIRPN